MSLKKRWTEEVKALRIAKETAEDALNLFNEKVGELEELRMEIEAEVSNDLDAYDEDEQGFRKMALILEKWEALGVEDCQTEFDISTDETMEDLDKVPWPEGWN